MGGLRGGMEVKCQLFQNMAMLHIKLKGYDLYINMVANGLPVDTSLVQVLESKGQNIFCLKEVMLHIKFKGMEHKAPCKHIVCSYTHPQPVGGSKG